MTSTSGSGSSRPGVPEPLRAGEGGVRGKDVAAGFGIGLALSVALWVVSNFVVFMMWFAGDLNVMGAFSGITMGVLQLAAYCLAIRWAVKRKRKGWAIGMAMFAAVGLLLAVAGVTIVVLMMR